MKKVLFLLCLAFPLFAERIYAHEISQQDREDVGFIVTSLSTKPLLSLLGSKGDLDAAGDRIDHLHPLNFLEIIFTDNELALHMRNIKSKHFIWNKHMMKGLRESLSRAAANDNIDPYLDEFAASVNIAAATLRGAVHQRNWDAFMDILFGNIKREDKHDQFDM